MAILEFIFYFFALLFIIGAIILNVFASQNLQSQPNFADNTTLTTPNTLLIISYILLIVAAFLLIVIMISSLFFVVPLATAEYFRFPFYLMLLVLLFVFIALVLNAIVYFQTFTSIPTITNFGNYVLISSILLIILFLFLLIFTAYGVYFTQPCIPSPIDAPLIEAPPIIERKREIIEEELPPVGPTLPAPAIVQEVPLASNLIKIPRNSRKVPTAATAKPCSPVLVQPLC